MDEIPHTRRRLVIGYGNPGRRDDGLGPALAEAVAARAGPGVETDADYQLTVEDAAALSGCDEVIFADASTDGPEPFSFAALEPAAGADFTTHHISPGAVLALAGELFDARPKAWLMGIRGYEFNEFGEGLSAGARRNLAAAADFLSARLRDGPTERRTEAAT
jgi:hydrogenase maturation protease